ncbi:hypothetical protein SAMN02745121_07234 [Nannocystis exedens]|uniref:Uncharacterized protein n=1 Tax=Nannocystis exedens TaxID=54 RepID=A0A1I2GFF2_9BACT|nr:hypothetical protein [Nannocystis exedens]PCC69990.1 hypothetical protein NAEX_03018 [Nannocystis exedens]SFF15923.1 hypothetical protein SAMN02745121_07234 [Nannocystis exedens]
MPRVSHRWCAAMLLLATCGRGEPEPADLQALRLPTGALLSPDGAWLFVTNSNLDLGVKTSTLVVLNLRALDQAFAEPPAPADAELSSVTPCRVSEAMSKETGAEGQEVVECDERYFIQREHSVRLTSGAGNIALDRPIGDEGPWRLLVPSSLEERAVTWIDVLREAGGIEVDCGQDAEGECDAAHSLQRLGNDPAAARLPSDPARIFVDREGYRFAYLPHLLGARMTLIALDAEYGPKITDITEASEGFFATEPLGKGVLAGGFAVDQRACDPDDPPPSTEGCTRPLLYASHRFWPGVRLFSVETGRDTIARFGNHWLLGVNPYAAGDRPFMGEVEFLDPEVGDRLLAVHTTPPSLSLVDTSLGPSGEPLNDPIDSVALCHNPNLLAIHRPKQGEAIAFISCYSDDEVAAVALGSFSVIATIPVDDGPNELVVDEARRKLYVVHTLASTIGVVELDSASPRRLQMIRRIGLGG